MRILAIDTSCPVGSVAVLDGDLLRFTENFRAERSHNSALFAPLGRALDAVDRKVDLLAVGNGPGSYTGVRVGLATAHGLGAVLEAPVAAWSSLAALAEEEEFHVVGDARREMWFLATVRQGKLTGVPEVFPLAEWESHRPAQGVPTFTCDPLPIFPGLTPAFPSAALLARRVASATREDRDAACLGPHQPVYLRAPYITTPRMR